MDKLRRIAKVFKSKPTIEGAGVHLKRAFGYQHVPQLDPFLLLDDFHADNPAYYLKGFPWHPHRGIVAALDQYGRVLVLGGWNGAAAVSIVNAFVMSDIAGANLIETTSPADGSIVCDTVVVNVQKVNGATNFQQIDLFVDGTLLETVIQTDTAAFLWDTSALADGSIHKLMARGYNTDGTVVEASVTVTISTLSAEQLLDDIEQQLAVLQAQLDIPGANLTALAMQAAILQAKLDGIIAGSIATNEQMNATFAGLQQRVTNFS